MKKILAGFMAVLTLMSVFAFAAQALEPTEAFKLIFSVEQDWFAVVDGFEGTAPKTLEIPETFEGRPVWKITEGAFRNCASIETFKASKELYMIESGAFAGCENLKTVCFSGSEYRIGIGESAFAGCKRLETVEIDDAVIIAASAFDGCENLKHVTLSACFIQENVFRGCGSLQKVTITGYDHAHTGMRWDSAYTDGCWKTEGNEDFMNAAWEWTHYSENTEVRSARKTAKYGEDFTLTIDYDMSKTDTCYWYVIRDDAFETEDGRLTENCPALNSYGRTETFRSAEEGIHTIYSEVVDADGNVVYQEDFYVDVRMSFAQRMAAFFQTGMQRLMHLIQRLKSLL